MKRILLILVLLLSSITNAQDFDFSCDLVISDPYYGFSKEAFATTSDEHKVEFILSLATDEVSIKVEEGYSNSHNMILNRWYVYLGDSPGGYTITKNDYNSPSQYQLAGNVWTKGITSIKTALGYPHINAPTEAEAAADVIAKRAKAIGDAYFLVNEIPSKHDFASTHINNLLALLNDRTCHNTRNNPKTNGDACLGSKYSGGPLTTANYFDNNYPDYTRHVEIWDGDVKIFNWLAGYDLEFNEVSNDRWNELNIDLMKLIATLNGGTTGNVDKDTAVEYLLKDVDYTTNMSSALGQLLNLFFVDIEVSLLTQTTLGVNTFTDANTGYAGFAGGGCNDTKIAVDFNTSYWYGPFRTDIQRAHLVYHELGHDVLDLEHKCGSLEVMHPGGAEGCTSALGTDDSWEAFFAGKDRMILLTDQNIKSCLAAKTTNVVHDIFD